MKKSVRKKLNNLKPQRQSSKLDQMLDLAIKKGTIKVNDKKNGNNYVLMRADVYFEMQSQIDELTQSISSAINSINPETLPSPKRDT